MLSPGQPVGDEAADALSADLVGSQQSLPPEGPVSAENVAALEEEHVKDEIEIQIPGDRETHTAEVVGRDPATDADLDRQLLQTSTHSVGQVGAGADLTTPRVQVPPIDPAA